LTSDPLGLERVAELHHSGTANVYAALFTPDGASLVSTSGDQTLRIWAR
jgi:WD40 repeat protein